MGIASLAHLRGRDLPRPLNRIEAAMRAIIHRGIPMPVLDPLVVKAILVSVTVVSLAVSNGVAWLADLNVGQIATSATILGLAVIGLVSQAIRQVGSARAQAWATRVRIEEQVRLEQERAHADSFAARIARLQEAVEEGNRRTEDANAKLHQMKGQVNLDRLLHLEESERLTEQVRLATEQLRATSAELHAARQELEAARRGNQRIEGENRELLRRLESTQRQVDINARNIGQIAVLSGEFPSVKPADDQKHQ